jgi:hypothetical protein
MPSKESSVELELFDIELELLDGKRGRGKRSFGDVFESRRLSISSPCMELLDGKSGGGKRSFGGVFESRRLSISNPCMELFLLEDLELDDIGPGSRFRPVQKEMGKLRS